jgi:transcriptional regulator with XRE-family HTH domain
MSVNGQYLVPTPLDILRQLGLRVRDRRIAAGLTQGELAKRVGVAPRTVRNLETGANVGIEPLLRVAIALDATPEFGALFPPVDTRSLDEILAAQRKTQRVRHRAAPKS